MVTQKPVFGTLLLWQRVLSVFVFGLIVLAVVCSPAQAAAKRAYAGIVVDAKTGKTLYSQAADSPRYPASVTKVMTLYLLFQELDAGRLKLSSKMRVSKHAAAAVPTKLGLRAGSYITVKDAIGTLVTLSANDISRVIAEHISGTESKFAERMTQTARALGMKRTTYRNASGLPDSRQVTTVRDQSRLGIAIYQHFPKYYEYFQMRSFKYGKRTYGNHNRLLGQNGVDGIKTGFIRASGYNLLTAARKNNRHIVVVAFGFDTGAKRNAKVAKLVSTYLPKSRRGSYVTQAQIARPGGRAGIIRVAAVPVTPMPRPANRGVPAQNQVPIARIAVASINLAAPAPEPRPVELVPLNANTAVAATAMLLVPSAPQPQPKPVNIVGAWVSETLRLTPPTAIGGPLLPPAAIGQPAGTIDLMTSGAIGNAGSNAPVQNWIVQIGATHNEGDARNLIGDATRKIGILANYRPFVEPTQKNGQVFYRARFAGFANQTQAAAMCDVMKKQQMSCLAVKS